MYLGSLAWPSKIWMSYILILNYIWLYYIWFELRQILQPKKTSDYQFFYQ